MEFRNLLQKHQTRIETKLKKLLPNNPKNILHKAMSYAVLNGGKRLRPLLIYFTGAILGCPLDTLDQPACAIELMHCYSLVHDDLPAMDNDDFRRGKPSCHKTFNEAIAILTGDALQTLSFEALTNTNSFLTSQQQIKMANILATASGAYGMANGQTSDIIQQDTMTEKQFIKMYEEKTGALIKASINLAIIAANCDTVTKINSLIQFANCLGLAYQIHDDIHDTPIEHQNTYTSIVGLSNALKKCQHLQNEAIKHLEQIDIHNSPLHDLTYHIFSQPN